jgi:hypothetical protein
MPPVQALVEALGARTDLFSFEGEVYERTTGVPPFRRAFSAAELEAIVQKTPAALIK